MACYASASSRIEQFLDTRTQGVEQIVGYIYVPICLRSGSLMRHTLTAIAQ